ncbi:MULTISPECIES: SDR family oxidoreductase [Enterovibrio]|uniref:NADP-dependent 3-hydroxy acid dehydrogenase YdfG n=2 Tax=Enterovibrio norvegicus TaxID=188144 RepID=A0A1I5SS72_9GAMM|nr:MULTISPECIES: SDR family oxidoreductase [Enterovibrio]MBE1275664.1 SDR family oxidoreductase [Enterovibrio baiacu]MCC4798428.1 SDR family oxidoreductase [Enterovibrio norvegicus]OEE50401.1 oxidoreductase [Enterovibrio norvegicus]OEF50255.1 oxidoreductase [Enterovibrio norvegicus]OEF56285.1 oxidoreductase [Enterovibrio norvegicus]
MKKLVVITGASSGIGEAIAKQFSAQGHPLLLLARRVDRLEALNLPNTLCKHVDVTDKASFDDAIAAAEAMYGEADLLVNNAGVMLLGDMATQDAAEWQTMFNVNVVGLMNGMQAVLAPMIARNSGTIINISSVAGRKTFPNHAAYCGTKFAVHAISENVREEVAAANVRVITIAPGAVETELLSHTTSDEIKAGYESWKEDMGGILAADDIANAVTYAYSQPQNVCVREIVLTATRQQP